MLNFNLFNKLTSETRPPTNEYRMRLLSQLNKRQSKNTKLIQRIGFLSSNDKFTYYDPLKETRYEIPRDHLLDIDKSIISVFDNFVRNHIDQRMVIEIENFTIQKIERSFNDRSRAILAYIGYDISYAEIKYILDLAMHTINSNIDPKSLSLKDLLSVRLLASFIDDYANIFTIDNILKKYFNVSSNEFLPSQKYSIYDFKNRLDVMERNAELYRVSVFQTFKDKTDKLQ